MNRNWMFWVLMFIACASMAMIVFVVAVGEERANVAYSNGINEGYAQGYPDGFYHGKNNCKSMVIYKRTGKFQL